jgi:predicted nuclease of predicted toxin-antitoxin system
VRILLDQNLSPKLVRQLADIFPELETVYDHELVGASDPVIFDWARRVGVSAVISADRDFVRLAEHFGAPPKVIRIERCDFPSRVVAALLRREAVRIQAFLESSRAVLELGVQRTSA